MSAGHHIGDEEAEKYSIRELSGAELSSCEEHLLTCEECRGRVRDADLYISAMYHAGTEIRRAHQMRPILPWAFATAGAAPVVLAAVLLMRDPRNTGWQEARLYAMRGAAVGAKVNAGRPLLLVPDLTGLPNLSSYRLQLVDATGKPIFTGEIKETNPTLKVNGIPTGIYFVRILTPAGDLLREYGLESNP